MVAKTPIVWSLSERATLAVWLEDPERGQQLVDIPLNSDQWFQWLELPNSKLFKFEPADQRISNFTACKEAGTGEDCWYAYKKLNNTLSNFYIGVSKDLTLVRLREAGLQMLQLAAKNNALIKQNLKKEECLKDSTQSQQVEHLKQELQRLGDQLAHSHQTHLITCQEQQETIERLRQQNQRLQTERDQMKEEIDQLYARNGALKLGKLLLEQESQEPSATLRLSIL